MTETVYILSEANDTPIKAYRELNDAFGAGPNNANWVQVSIGRWVNLNLATRYAAITECEVV